MATMNGVPFRKNLVPSSKYSLKSPYSMKPKKITIHATDNQATAWNEISYMRNNNTSTSFHFATDEKEIVQGLPTNRNGFHAGDGRNGYGNRNTIGWEMARSYDRSRKTTNLKEPLKTQFGKAYDNTVKGVAQLCIDEGIVANKSNLKPHQAWSGKYCPRILFDWNEFNKLVDEIIKEYNRLKSGKSSGSTVQPSKPSSSGGEYRGNSIVDYLNSKGIDSSPANRRKLAKEYGVSNYNLSAKKNLELLNAMRDGKKPSQSKPKPSSSGSTTFKVGDTVKIKASARTYATGESIPSRYKNKPYTIQQVKSDRVLIKELYSWVRKSDLVGGSSSSSKTSQKPSFKVGSKVTIKNSAKTYATGETIPSRYKGKSYTIQQVKSDRVLLKELYSWVR